MDFTNNGAEIMRVQTGQLLFLGLCIFMTIAESSDEKEKVDPEKVEYAKGSVCGYCEYCKVPMLTNDKDTNLNTHINIKIVEKLGMKLFLLIFLTVLPAL